MLLLLVETGFRTIIIIYDPLKARPFDDLVKLQKHERSNIIRLNVTHSDHSWICAVRGVARVTIFFSSTFQVTGDISCNSEFVHVKLAISHHTKHPVLTMRPLCCASYSKYENDCINMIIKIKFHNRFIILHVDMKTERQL